MSVKETVTCSFVMDRALYEAYKSIVLRNNENVKGNLVRYMKEVVKYDTPNAETIEALREINDLKQNDKRKSYDSFSQLMEDIEHDL